MSDTLPLLFKELKLPAFNQYYEVYQQQATTNGWSYAQFFTGLCEQEAAERFQSRVRDWMRDAKLPSGKSLATLTLTDLPNTVQK